MSKMYLYVPGIEGNITVKGHEKWIQIQSLDFAASRSLNTQPGNASNREGSRPTLSEMVITKVMDSTSPLLFKESVVGTAKSAIKIELTTAVDNLSTYMQYTLSNAIISGYKVSQHPSHEKEQEGEHNKKTQYPIEEISINFDKLEKRFTAYDANNQPQSPISTGYDLAQATAL